MPKIPLRSPNRLIKRTLQNLQIREVGGSGQFFSE